MKVYKFVGRDREGKKITGDMPAESSAALAEQLLKRGIQPLEVKESASLVNLSLLEELFGQTPPKTDDLVLMSRQLQTLVRAGIPMVRAINGVQGGSRNAMLQKALNQIAMALEAGQDLSRAMASHPKIFSSLFINMIRVGETTGRLDEAFGQLYRYMELDAATSKQIKSALRYPTFVMSGMFGALFVMTYFVLPNFMGFFQSFKLDLPWQTKLLMATSRFTVNYWYVILISLVAGIAWFLSHIQKPEGKLWWDQMKFKLPIVGDIIKRGTLARFSRSFAMASKSGVPILGVLESVAHAVDNAYVAKKIWEMMIAIERGESLVQAAYATQLFPPLVIQMLAVGEESGSMDQMMDDIASFYEREVEYDVKALSSAIEPLITIVMGIMIAILAMGVFLPLWDLVKGAK
ncbi:MAG: type II secretion system F family protein [Magnetococcales bacterium]|nr:type II secretion system F family protein [Magnetococcales bacterium]